ncbi:exonuclease domain-containing protein [Photobacterium sp. TY 1-4]|uniref:Exonuclease domain-containing protein n=2 Tax=Pseudosulfitobacter koreensis TaxID=2968472 RepID=A0ABT1Z2F8_9RHOB|nr:exonuclease domain-containing protein [Pseudosulfitobacter koreense]
MKILPDIETYAALDFEASSLAQDSWPIEVGLSWMENGDVRTWSSLIRPAPEWSLSAWSSRSAAVHGVTHEALHDAPTAPGVVEEFFKILDGKSLVSDAPEFDARWFSRLLQAGGCYTVPTVADYHDVSFARFSGLALDMLYETLGRHPAPHRAGPDSARLLRAWRVALQY